MSVTEAMIQVMASQRETEWNQYIGRLAASGRLSEFSSHEQVLHDLYVAGEITLDEVYLVESGQMLVEEVVGDTSVLAYACILCRDLGCEFCGKVE